MSDSTELSTTTSGSLAHAQAVGEAFNAAAAVGVFANYRERKAAQTLRAHDTDLALFADFLSRASKGHIQADDMGTSPAAWRAVTWGLVQGFVNEQVQRGYAVGSVNRRLGTVKAYARRANLAGALDGLALAQIEQVKGYYSNKEAQHLDEQREAEGIATRAGSKKAEHVALSQAQATALLAQPTDTPQGRRDSLLMALLLEHGLRVGEVASLRVEHFKLEEGLLEFYRAKVGITQTHRLSRRTLAALRAYEAAGDMPPAGPLLRGSSKSGKLTKSGMSTRAINKRVQALGAAVGLDGLSPHDCRHYWATYWAQRVERLPKGLLTLQEAGGWASLSMPRHYVEAASIANEGMG